MSDLDRYFPKQGPCAFCCGQQDARHRVIYAIRERVAAGESREDVAEDYGVSVDAVNAACEALASRIRALRELADEVEGK